MQTSQANKPPGDAFIGVNGIFVGLVLHQVRPCDRAAVASKQSVNSSRNLNPSPVSILDPNAGSIFTPGPERALTIAQGASLAPMETLLAELARRRLRSLTVKKRA
jgi:hypothetical protein